MTNLTVANWNIGGAKFLQLPPAERKLFQQQLNAELDAFCRKWQPDVICLQEATSFQLAGQTQTDVLTPPDGYAYHMSPVLDSRRHSHPVRWGEYREAGQWQNGDHIYQGNGFLWKKELCHASIWSFDAGLKTPELEPETIPIDTGLFTGDRDTEPRCVCLTHFILPRANQKLLDVFVANLHLSTLHGERAGQPAIDKVGSKVRTRQLWTVLHGVISRHMVWAQMLDGDASEREQLWLLCGDFNAAPLSDEIMLVKEFGFIDLNPNKGKGNKAQGLGNDPTHTVDYLFLGQFGAEAATAEREIYISGNPAPDLNFKVSDHFPVISRLPY